MNKVNNGTFGSECTAHDRRHAYYGSPETTDPPTACPQLHGKLWNIRYRVLIQQRAQLRLRQHHVKKYFTRSCAGQLSSPASLHSNSTPRDHHETPCARCSAAIDGNTLPCSAVCGDSLPQQLPQLRNKDILPRCEHMAQLQPTELGRAYFPRHVCICTTKNHLCKIVRRTDIANAAS